MVPSSNYPTTPDERSSDQPSVPTSRSREYRGNRGRNAGDGSSSGNEGSGRSNDGQHVAIDISSDENETEGDIADGDEDDVQETGSLPRSSRAVYGPEGQFIAYSQSRWAQAGTVYLTNEAGVKHAVIVVYRLAAPINPDFAERIHYRIQFGPGLGHFPLWPTFETDDTNERLRGRMQGDEEASPVQSYRWIPEFAATATDRAPSKQQRRVLMINRWKTQHNTGIIDP